MSSSFYMYIHDMYDLTIYILCNWKYHYQLNLQLEYTAQENLMFYYIKRNEVYYYRSNAEKSPKYTN